MQDVFIHLTLLIIISHFSFSFLSFLLFFLLHFPFSSSHSSQSSFSFPPSSLPPFFLVITQFCSNSLSFQANSSSLFLTSLPIASTTILPTQQASSLPNLLTSFRDMNINPKLLCFRLLALLTNFHILFFSAKSVYFFL